MSTPSSSLCSPVLCNFDSTPASSSTLPLRGAAHREVQGVTLTDLGPPPAPLPPAPAALGLAGTMTGLAAPGPGENKPSWSPMVSRELCKAVPSSPPAPDLVIVVNVSKIVSSGLWGRVEWLRALDRASCIQQPSAVPADPSQQLPDSLRALRLPATSLRYQTYISATQRL
jgi:hypothetical protein